MRRVIFIAPSFENVGPRTIRVANLIQQLNSSEQGLAMLLKYRNSKEKQTSTSENVQMTNNYSWIHFLFRICGVYHFSRHLSESAKKIGPLAISNFLIKWDLRDRKLEFNNEYTVFVVVVSPFTNYLLVPWLKKEFSKVRIVLDIGDPLYLNSARDNNDEYSKQVEQNAITLADTILVTNQLTKEFFIKTYKVERSRIVVVPQGVDVELISSTKLANLRATPYTLAYAGRFYEGLRSPASLFEAMSKQAKYTLYLYGSNWGKSESNVVEFSKMPQKQLFKELHGNELLVFIDNDKGIQTSGKIYELLAFGKPLLFIKGSERSEAMTLAENYDHVIFAENEPDAILAALRKYEEYGVPQIIEPLLEYSWKSRAALYKKAIEL